MYRRLFWALAVVLVLVAIGLTGVYVSRDHLIATAIRTYGPPITGGSVGLGGVRLLPWDGEATLNDLELGNPPGFSTPHALVVAKVHLGLDVRTLRADVVHIREIRVEQARVTYEYASTGSNLDVLQRHIQSQIADALPSGGASDAANSPPLRVIIDHVDILGARADVSATALHGRTMTVNLPDIHLSDIGTRTGGVTPAEAIGQMVASVRQAATQAVLPLHLGGAVQSARNGAATLVDKVKGWFK